MSSSSRELLAEKIAALERKLADAEAELDAAKGIGDNKKERAAMNLVASLNNRLAALEKKSSAAPVDITSLLGRGRSDAGVIRRMESRFPGQVSLALQQGNSQLAQDTYDEASLLPSLYTLQHLKISGFIGNGPLFEGSSLTIYYKLSDNSKHILKCLSQGEAQRVASFQDSNPSHPHIIAFKVWRHDHKGKTFMLMPALPSTLEPMPYLTTERINMLWLHIGSALSYLHSLGFAHGDVKPSNLGISNDGDFILIDLGSISKFGELIHTTPAYIPGDYKKHDQRASATLDWMMFSVTLSEKCCGEHGLDIGSRATTPASSQIIEHLNNFLPPNIVTELQAKLV